ncbi:MAG: ABC transporter permease [Oscillospiraceae bacterium]
MDNLIVYMSVASVSSAIPLTLAGLGGVISERAGVMNLSLEGNMLMGAFFGMYISYISGSPWLGALGGMLAGVLLAAIMAVMCVTLKANQIVVATGINIIAVGITGYCLKMFNIFVAQGTVASAPAFKNIHIPFLSDIPYIGEALFSYKPLVYITLLLIVVVHFYLYKTKLGLVHRSIGENPIVADTLGINISKVRYGAVLLCGALCGLAGSYMSISNLNTFQDQMVSGRGFIAFAAVIFGKWNPIGVFGAAMIFGFADALQMRMQSMQTGISYHILQTIPYLMTMIALATIIGKSESPAANGTPYNKE